MLVDFREAQLRLILHLRNRVRSGEVSERSLARALGLSQPHLHNVLKGKYLFSIPTADRILRHLRIDLADLVGPRQPG